jgi:hypothetical protein
VRISDHTPRSQWAIWMLCPSSHVIQKPPWPSATIAEPWEFTDPGTSRIFVGPFDAGPSLNCATLIEEPCPKYVHDSKTCVVLIRMAGLSWKVFAVLSAIW